MGTTDLVGLSTLNLFMYRATIGFTCM